PGGALRTGHPPVDAGHGGRGARGDSEGAVVGPGRRARLSGLVPQHRASVPRASSGARPPGGGAHRLVHQEAGQRRGPRRTLAVIASRGSFNSLVQVITLLMAAVGSEIAVRVFFRDEAVFKLTAARIGEMNLSEVYAGQEARVRERLASQGLTDLAGLLQQVRACGDVRLYACSSSMAICGVRAEDLLEGIEVRGLTSFLLEDVAAADRVLTF